MEEIITLLISIIAGILTYIISNNLKKGGVMGSAVVTLVAGLILPEIFPTIGGNLAVAATAASYAGMISTENALNIWEMSIISLMTGILFIAASNAYVGIGGRLGTIAAISCFAWLGFKKAFVGVDEIFEKKI